MVLSRLLSIPLSRHDSQNSRNSGTPEPSESNPGSPNSSSASSGLDVEEPAPEHQIHLPALASPVATTPATPWPFGSSVSGRERSLSNATATTLDARTHSVSTLDINKPSPSALPHEILLAILKLVPSNTDLKSSILVCKSWCQCGVELLWHKPYISDLKALDHHLTVLNSPRPTFQYNDFVRRVNLSLLSNHVTDSVLVKLSECTRMERLTLSGSSHITDKGLGYLLSQCNALVALDLSDCVKLSDLTCLAISKNCRRLQGLNLSGCKAMADVGISAIGGECRELRRVKLRGLENLTDAGVIALAQSCPMLLELDLFSCQHLTDPTLWAIWYHLGHVRELTVNGAQITDEAFPVADAAGRPSIRHQEFLDTLQGQLKKTYVTVPNSHFEHVRYLDLTSQVTLTDSAVESIVTFMPKVRNLILSKCTGLTDDSIDSICRLGKNLHYLHLSHVSHITDRSVIRLARQCTRLRYIDLACCTQLTDLSVFELALLPRLKRIGLVRVTNLTDDAVFALAERKSLERIHLSYCDRISVQAVHFLLQGLHHLTHLSLTGVPAFRQPELQTFCRPPPREFNSHQQQTFCVYSGAGVADLRHYLTDSQRHREDTDDVDTARQRQEVIDLYSARRNIARRANGVENLTLDTNNSERRRARRAQRPILTQQQQQQQLQQQHQQQQAAFANMQGRPLPPPQGQGLNSPIMFGAQDANGRAASALGGRTLARRPNIWGPPGEMDESTPPQAESSRQAMLANRDAQGTGADPAQFSSSAPAALGTFGLGGYQPPFHPSFRPTRGEGVFGMVPPPIGGHYTPTPMDEDDNMDEEDEDEDEMEDEDDQTPVAYARRRARNRQQLQQFQQQG